MLKGCELPCLLSTKGNEYIYVYCRIIVRSIDNAHLIVDLSGFCYMLYRKLFAFI